MRVKPNIWYLVSLTLAAASILSISGTSVQRATALTLQSSVTQGSRTWSFQWQPAPSSAISQLPHSFSQFAYVLDPRLVRHAPASVSWLVISATFGVALVQLDPARTSMGLVYLTTAGNQIVANALVVARPTSGQDVPAIPSLPSDSYSSASQTRGFSPQFAMQLWVSSSRTFAFGYFPLTIDKPLPSSQPVQVLLHPAWLTQQGALNSVLIALTGHVLLFAGTDDARSIQTLAGQCLQDLPDLTSEELST